jgi:hypothetical protein
MISCARVSVNANVNYYRAAGRAVRKGEEIVVREFAKRTVAGVLEGGGRR